MIDHDGLLWMYYCAGGDSKDRYRIHLATSSDGWTWTRHPGNPMVVDGQTMGGATQGIGTALFGERLSNVRRAVTD